MSINTKNFRKIIKRFLLPRNHFVICFTSIRKESQNNTFAFQSINFGLQAFYDVSYEWVNVWCVCVLFTVVSHIRTKRMYMWRAVVRCVIEWYGIPWRNVGPLSLMCMLLLLLFLLLLLLELVCWCCFLLHILSFNKRIVATRFALLTAATAASSSMARTTTQSICHNFNIKTTFIGNWNMKKKKRMNSWIKWESAKEYTKTQRSSTIKIKIKCQPKYRVRMCSTVQTNSQI